MAEGETAMPGLKGLLKSLLKRLLTRLRQGVPALLIVAGAG